MPRVAVATDSAASLPPGAAEAFGVHVVPLQVIIDDVATAEGEGAGPQAVTAALVYGKKVTTSQPGPERLRAAVFAAESERADHLVFVCLSRKVSGTYGAMEAVAREASIPVTIVDSATVGFALGLAALSAASVARGGGTPEQVAYEAQRVSLSSLSLFTVDTLDYLKRGGRVSPAVAAIGNALGVRPLLGLVDGEVKPVERVRTTAKARAAVVGKVMEAAGLMSLPLVGVMTVSGDDELADATAAGLRGQARGPVVTTRLSAALAAHCGPGALAACAVDAHPTVAAYFAQAA